MIVPIHHKDKRTRTRAISQDISMAIATAEVLGIRQNVDNVDVWELSGKIVEK